MTSTPTFDQKGNFQGFTESPCGEHRTVDDHRAWCYNDTTWCYPHDPCPGCAEALYVRVPVAEWEEIQRRLSDLGCLEQGVSPCRDVAG